MAIRVLHVDDYEEFVRLAAERMEREDERLAVETADDAAAALERLDDGTAPDIDCVVSDYEMPGMDGLDLLDAVRERDPDLPFVLFTGRGDETVARDALRAGATDYVRKGTSTDDGRYAVLANRVVNAVERRRAAAAAERERERFRALIANSTDLITVLAADGTIRYESPSIEHILGYGQAELEGESAFEYVHPEDREEVVETFSCLVDGERTTETVRFRFRHADGSWRWLESTGSTPGSDAVDGYVVNSRDVTDRVARERRFEAERDRIRVLFEHTTDAIAYCGFVTGEDGVRSVIREANPAFHETFVDDRETLVDADLDEVVAPPGDVEEARAISRRVRSGERVERELERQTSDDVRTFLHRSVPITPEEGETTDAYYAVYTDITEQKERERRLRRQNERLERFASLVSHDLRNPLNVAAAAVERARDADADADRRLDQAADALGRMEGIVGDVLDMVRYGGEVTETEPIELGPLVEGCWGAVATDGATLDVVDPDAAVAADRGRLRRLVENLLGNAVEHGADGDRSAADDDPAVRVEVGTLPDGFYVEDDGPGIPPAEPDRVFDADYSSSEDGVGLGLTIVEDIAVAHGWEVDVTEGAAGGARFEVRGAVVESPDARGTASGTGAETD
ncbi:MAG: PAS domain S-box protein [Haloferacaceae archaeon]